MKKYNFLLIFSFLLFGCLRPSYSQAPVKKEKITTRILFMFDMSNSMNGTWKSGTKVSVAKRLFGNMLDSLKNKPNLELALRVYGHQKPFPPQDCDDTKLEVDFAPNNSEAIKNRIKAIEPRGTTPIAASLLEAANDFTKKDNCRNIIILITDGVEACDGDPCAVSLALQKQGIMLKPFIIGIGTELAEFKKAFECVGTYFDATSEDQFSNILNVVISQALNSTTAQVNLLDAFGKPSETNVNMSFYDEFSGIIKYNYVHTINNRGVPDTVLLDPILTYRMVVHTIPPVEKKGIKLNSGKHNIIAADCPQGTLTVKTNGNNDYKVLPSIIVRKKGETATLNVQTLNKTEKYLTGKYEIEILCLPRLIINDVDISQSKTTTVQIPQPGLCNILSSGPGYGSLFVEEKNELKLILNFDENMTRESLVLLPGKYRIEYRSKAAKETLYSVEREFKIESGQSVQIKLF